MTASQFKTARRKLGLSQEAFGLKLGMSRRMVQYMESGRSKIEKRTELAVNWIFLTKTRD